MGRSTTSSGGSYLQRSQSGTTAESFVDHLKRSASTVNPKNRPAPIAKPIRRSKSQRSQNFVTSIQHGGSVTLVSLNGDLDQENSAGKPNEIKHVHHHHFVQDWDGNGIHPGGSQTLPNRKSGKNKPLALKPAAADDSSVAIIKKQGLNGVKIQLNLNEQVHQNSELCSCDDFEEKPLVLSQKLEKQREKVEKRKYTLE